MFDVHGTRWDALDDEGTVTLDSLLDRLWNRRVVEVDVEYVQLVFR